MLEEQETVLCCSVNRRSRVCGPRCCYSMRQLISEVKAEHPRSIMIHEDNQSAISMTRNPQFHVRSKHLSIKYHFVQNHVSEGSICLKYYPSEEMTADFLTKGFGKEQFIKSRKLAGITP